MSRPERRRRLGALVAAAGIAAAAGVAVGARDPAPAPTAPAGREAAPAAREARAPGEGRRQRPPLGRQVGTLIIMRFAGTEPPAYVLRALRRERAAGVILFGDNITSPEQLRNMARRLQGAAGGDALICTDQEGGHIRNLPWAAPVSGQYALATPEAARETAEATIRDIRRAGINLNLAPVADVASVPGSVMRSRAFAGDAEEVALAVRATVEAYEGSGVAPTVKHFPGLGGATANTDDEPVTVTRSARDIGSIDLPPFAAAVNAGVPAVMMSHALYPALDPDDIASQSREVVEGLLRGRLGFDGVVMTDSLEARAVTARTPDPGDAALASLRAGVDVMLTTGRGSHIRVLRALLAAAREDPALRARVEESAQRVLELRRELVQRQR